MTQTIRAALVMLLVGLSPTALAQGPRVSRAPIGGVVDLWVTKTEQLVIPAAEALPEGSYAFAPTAGQFAGVRTFAEQITHLPPASR
jgi:hypothetical protein